MSPMTHSPPNSGSTCFITIEGGEGAGKTTLAQALAERLRAQGRSVRLTREPGGSALGQALRTLVLDPQLQLTDWSETCLFLADRGANVEGVIRPALAAGEIVFCDRYLDSTLAYQGYGRGLDLGLLRRLNEAVTGGLLPELTLLLDLPPELGLARTRARSDPGRPHRRRRARLPRARQCRLSRAGGGGTVAHPSDRRDSISSRCAPRCMASGRAMHGARLN